MTDPSPAPDDVRPIVVLVEWQAPGLSVEDAERVADHATLVLREQPDLVDARFFGDFDGGTHCFLLTWRNRAAMEAYMASEQMQSVRSAAAPFVAGAPSRRMFVDYSTPRQGTVDREAP